MNNKLMNNVFKRAVMSVLSFVGVTMGVGAEKAEPVDWMLDGASYKGRVEEKNGGRDVVITNGLVERILRNGTTIGLNNLYKSEGLLRSIRPEAELVLDNITLPVGGMLGQPIHNYFLPEWLDTMTEDPMAMKYVGYTTTEIKPRFDWKPRKEWMSWNPEWPAKGKHVTFQYKVDDKTIELLAAREGSEENRVLLLKDEFAKISPEWKVEFSSSNTANSFNNEGKAGEMLIAGNTAAYVERPLDKAAEVVTVKINPGTDKSASWGPGVSWVFDNHKVKLYARAGEGKFGINNSGEGEVMIPGLKEGVSVSLKMQRAGDKLLCSYSYDDKQWTPLRELSLPAKAVSQSVRVGKMDRDSGKGEFAPAGEVGRCRVEGLTVRGGFSPQSAERSRYEYLKDVNVFVHYEIYDGIPLLCKWVTLENKSSQKVNVASYKSEILAVLEPENSTAFEKMMLTPNITVESDFVHCFEHDEKNPDINKATQRHTHWNHDKLYTTQTDWLLKTPCLLESYPEYGPDVDVATGESFETQRTWELIHDTWERERKTLQIRQMYRVAAPWVAENPIFMHVRSADNESVKKAVDQCAEVGFEMVIMTFGSGVNIEDASEKNLQRMKEIADYAHSKGIALGGYSLLASRSINKENDVVQPAGKSPMFGASPCVESPWGQQYMANIKKYFEVSGQDIFEHDGSYPGDECASTTHPGHKGLNDSQWKQYQSIKKFYHWCKSEGIFLNIPDMYFMNGQNKTGMGYRETNWSLPREQQEIIERQNIYDGTWMKTPAMGWMMVPLVQYHGGGAAATIEPLKDHLPHYETRLSNLFGAGVIACYRGPQLFDTPETKAIVKKWTDFYKQNRAVLDGDIIHLRRADGNDWDGFVHVNPRTKQGMLMVYNPLKQDIKRTIKVPLYYTGIRDQVEIKEQNKGKAARQALQRDDSIRMEISIPAKSCNWYMFDQVKGASKNPGR